MNVFRNLSKYGSSEPENYLTESFVYLLQLLFAESKENAYDLLSRLIDIPILEILESPSNPVFVTQEYVEEGILDISISIGSEVLTYIEVKHDASLGHGQLEYYKGLVDDSDAPYKSLVLLTRSKQSAIETSLKSDQFHHICWYEVHAWLRELIGSDDVLDHFIFDFLEFLEEKNMSLQRVGWEYERGVSSLLDLTGMMEAAVGEVFSEMKMKCTAGWSWRGFYLDDKYFFGIRYDQVMTLAFEDNLGTNPEYKEYLSLNEAHFFSLDSGEQFECIVAFLRTNKKAIK